MLAWLMRVIRLLFGGRRPRDPQAGVRHPIARRPSGNSTAVAVEEPDEDRPVTLVGRSG